MNTSAGYPVLEVSGVAEARRAALAAASRLDFSDAAAGRVALVVTELATNLAKHARGGEILLRPSAVGTHAPEIEVISIDKGPGIADVDLSRRDGHSTSGTLGHGLGAIERMADYFEIYTHASGTAALATVSGAGGGSRSAAGGEPAVSAGAIVGGVLVAKPGEDVCGDDWAWHFSGDRITVIVADGLGHGLPAHEASRAALLAFERYRGDSPARIVSAIHAALKPTRGGAVAAAAIESDGEPRLRFAGVGNISGAIVTGSGARQGLTSMYGTAGHTVPRVQEFSYALPDEAIVILHSDGLGTQWNLMAYPGLSRRHPSLIGAVLYRDFSRRRDDVAVVVIRPEGGPGFSFGGNRLP